MYTEASSKEEMAELVIISHVSQTNEYSHCKGTKATIILTAGVRHTQIFVFCCIVTSLR